MRFQDSKLAHKYLDGLFGVEIGASAHNPFNLKNCIYISNNTDPNNIHHKEEMNLCGEIQKVDILAEGRFLPFKNNSLNYILSSHVIEHIYDVIGTLKEWWRVIKVGGYLFNVVPHKERTFDKDRFRTSLRELIDRYENKLVNNGPSDQHHSVWIISDFIEICNYLQFPIIEVLDIDDKVGNGFTIVCKRDK